MHFTRLYADANGESHFRDETIELNTVDFAPPAPPVNVSEPSGAKQVAFLTLPAGWYGKPHPAPARNLWFVLSGEIEITASDGERRRFPAGSIFLTEDTSGKGHATEVVSGTEVRFAFVEKAD